MPNISYPGMLTSTARVGTSVEALVLICFFSLCMQLNTVSRGGGECPAAIM